MKLTLIALKKSKKTPKIRQFPLNSRVNSSETRNMGKSLPCPPPNQGTPLPTTEPFITVKGKFKIRKLRQIY
jgi:hypothetical protein